LFDQILADAAIRGRAQRHSDASHELDHGAVGPDLPTRTIETARAMAACRDLAIGGLCLAETTNIAAGLRRDARRPTGPLALHGLT
jgi:hypothetical protein